MKPVHLVTVVGGSVDALRHMLAHYRSMGIQPIFRNLHLSSDDDQVRDQVQTIAREDRQENRKENRDRRAFLVVVARESEKCSSVPVFFQKCSSVPVFSRQSVPVFPLPPEKQIPRCARDDSASLGVT